MAKEIPFFKFFVGEWANGDITAENYKTQGVFINICSVYWTKEGELSEVFLRKKIKANKEITLLIESEIIKVEDKNIVISFLDEQLSECEGIRVKNSEAGKKSARQRALNKRSTSVQPKLNEEPTESQPLREDKEKKREEKKREEIKRKEYKPNFETLFSKIKTRAHQNWILEVYEDRKETSARCEDTVTKFMDNTMKESLYEFCYSSKNYGITFYNETGCINYWKLASKGYISDVDQWRKKLKKIKERTEDNIINVN
tara:strand:- start:410 stop:1183 length:774 start_codon:yes stop_codon:yes gene_type:complete